MIAFVILHYQTLEDTLGCIESLKAQCESFGHKVVVVDNCSPNGSFNELRDSDISNYSFVKLFKTKENLGFAKGNNFGCLKANELMNPDYFVVLNNDTLLFEHQIENLEIELIKEDFDVLGPRIKSLIDHQEQNPIYNFKYNSFKQVFVLFCVYLIKQFLWCFKLDQFLPSKQPKIAAKKGQDKSDFMLHGSAIVFSRKYFQKFRNVFYPRTFLYMEETLLYLRKQKYKLLFVFNDRINFYHKEDSSTNSLFGAVRSKRGFVYKNQIRSCYVTLKYMLFGEDINF